MNIRAAQAVIDGELVNDVLITTSAGIITSIGEQGASTHRVAGILIPGFVDMHCHGGGGYAFSDSNIDNVYQAIQTHKKHGTASLIASLVTDRLETLHQQIRRLKPLVSEGLFYGIHLEGPYLSHVRCGAHDPELLIHPNIDHVKELLEIADGAISMFTIAPELPGALAAIKYLNENQVVAALGHSQADAMTTRAAIESGATLITHYSNAMPKPAQGAGTITEEALKGSDIPLEIILDGVHVAPELMRQLWAEQKNRIALITDAMAGAGSADGDYRIGALEVEVRDQVARLKSNGALAGSTLTMDRAFTILIKDYGATVVEAVHAAAELPARVLGLSDVGAIKVGAKAHFNEICSDGSIKTIS